MQRELAQSRVTVSALEKIVSGDVGYKLDGDHEKDQEIKLLQCEINLYKVSLEGVYKHTKFCLLNVFFVFYSTCTIYNY